MDIASLLFALFSAHVTIVSWAALDDFYQNTCIGALHIWCTQMPHDMMDWKFSVNYLETSKNKPYIIGITGGSASGKTSLSIEIFKTLELQDCLLISMDSYYRVISDEERSNLINYNFDHPSAFDFELLYSNIRDLLNDKDIDMPIYDFTTSSRLKETKKVKPSKLIIFEGIFALYDPRIRSLMDMKIFVDTDDDVRLARRSKII